MFAGEIVAAYAQETTPKLRPDLRRACQRGQAEELAGVFREDVPLLDPVRTVRDCVTRIRRFDCRQRVDELTLRLGDNRLVRRSGRRSCRRYRI